MSNTLSDTIACLEALNKSRVLVYINDERPSTQKWIGDEDVPPLYNALRSIGNVSRLDLVLHTGGGRVNVSRKIALLLRSFAEYIRVLVPVKIRSSGMLLCLSSDEIIMSPISELGPLDSHTVLANDASTGGPLMISAEDVRQFNEMAQDWFDLSTSDDRVHIFELLNRHIFPTTLTTMYRGDQQIRQIATELLTLQCPENNEQTCQTIVDQLVSGYYAHDYVITREEAADLGLHVRDATSDEEQLLRDVWTHCCRWMIRGTRNQQGIYDRVNGVIATATTTMIHVENVIEYMPTSGTSKGSHPLRMTLDAQWQLHHDIND